MIVSNTHERWFKELDHLRHINGLPPSQAAHRAAKLATVSAGARTSPRITPCMVVDAYQQASARRRSSNCTMRLRPCPVQPWRHVCSSWSSRCACNSAWMCSGARSRQLMPSCRWVDGGCGVWVCGPQQATHMQMCIHASVRHPHDLILLSASVQ